MQLNGELDRKRVGAPRDSGCNMNVVSHEIFLKNSKSFNWKKCYIELSTSTENSIENASKVIQGAILIVGNHSYKSNRLVANC